ncbi:hypothetical protein ACU4GD_10870 [Cupriavidus basilensis]
MTRSSVVLLRSWRLDQSAPAACPRLAGDVMRGSPLTPALPGSACRYRPGRWR